MSQDLASTQASGADNALQYFSKVLLGENPLYRKLVQRSLAACIPYAVSMLLVVFAIYRGLCDARQGWLLCAGMLTTVIAFHVAFRSGWSQHFRDPSLSFAGVLTGMSWTVLIYLFGGAIHATQLLFLGLVMGLGVFSLNSRDLRLTCLYGVTTMGCAIITMAQLAPDQYPPVVAYFYLAVLVICLPTLMALGMQRVKLTDKLKRQKAELADSLARLKEIAIRDTLTGLYNRGHMIELFQHAVARQDRTGETFSFVMFDLDFFKRVNDTHGHGVGDDVLRAFATVATNILRKSDVLARWGGEEFVAICPHSDDPQAVVGVERLLKEWSSTEVSPQAPQLRVSFSAGITTYRPGEAIDEALGRADKALYAAKAKGRNCIVRL
jgi:diguanylate cyclase (GGDEF)-like protein